MRGRRLPFGRRSGPRTPNDCAAQRPRHHVARTATAGSGPECRRRRLQRALRGFSRRRLRRCSRLGRRAAAPSPCRSGRRGNGVASRSHSAAAVAAHLLQHPSRSPHLPHPPRFERFGVSYTRAVLERFGPFPGDIAVAEDVVVNGRLLEAGVEIEGALDVVSLVGYPSAASAVLREQSPGALLRSGCGASRLACAGGRAGILGSGPRHTERACFRGRGSVAASLDSRCRS